MATLKTMVDNVLGMLGEDGTGFIRSSDVKTWLNQGLDIVSEVSLSIQTRHDIPATPMEYEYALPADLIFIRHVLIGQESLKRVNVEEWRYANQSQKPATIKPWIFAQWQKQMYVHPAPIEPGTLIRVYYFKKSSPLEQDTDAPEFDPAFHHILEDFALWRAYLKYRNPNAAQAHRAGFDQGLAALQARYGPASVDPTVRLPEGGA